MRVAAWFEIVAEWVSPMTGIRWKVAMELVLVGDLGGPGHGVMSGGFDLSALAGALVERGHQVRAYTPLPVAADSALIETAAGYAVVPIPVCRHPVTDADLMPRINEMGRFLLAAWAAQPPDVVHCQGWVYGMAAQLAADRSHIATVQAFDSLSTVRRRFDHDGDRYTATARLESLLAKNATRVVTSCTDDMAEVIRMGRSRRHVSVLPGAVDVERYAVNGDTAGRDVGRHRVVAVVRSPVLHRGFDYLVEALAALPSVELVLAVGRAADGTAVHDLMDRATHFGVRERLRVIEVADDGQLAPLLRSADVVVCPSVYEPCGTTVLEAMACAAPVVATAAGAALDAVVHDVTGLLVPPMNADALARAIKSILAQYVLREGMGLAGRARVRSRYGWDRVAADAEAVYAAAFADVLALVRLR